LAGVIYWPEPRNESNLIGESSEDVFHAPIRFDQKGSPYVKELDGGGGVWHT
jgi:hypothetical protein